MDESWASSLPPPQGLYDPSQEKDACGVGFFVNISGKRSNDILRKAVKEVVCRMTHRGATGPDERDGDGAGVMTGIPHEFFQKVLQRDMSITLPPVGQYATGNVYLNPDHFIRLDCKARFEEYATSLGLEVLCWRPVPRNNSILGPSALSKEPTIEQPFITTKDRARRSDSVFLERQLYLLRKLGANRITLRTWFYVCSLSSKTMIYKGLLNPNQLWPYFLDLQDPDFLTHFALVHSRFSTNTFPSWDRAQPFRLCAHNGEINSLRGNRNWMRAREGVLKSEKFKDEITKLFPIIEEFGSDSASFDNCLELLVSNGILSLPEAVMMMIPEAWQNNPMMTTEKRAFYEWASAVMEPWDGPALFTFSDGRFIGATLDRNGLRPARFYITKDGYMICASEVGTISFQPENIAAKGRLQPGKMLLVDTQSGVIVDDTELKRSVALARPYAEWLRVQKISMTDLQRQAEALGVPSKRELDARSVSDDLRLQAHGYSLETVNLLLAPMAIDGKEALGSMGNDAPLACLSRQPRPIYEYFRQLFAQVTNPPIDPIREAIVMSLQCFVGPEGNLLDVSAQQCRRLLMPSPIIPSRDLEIIRRMSRLYADWKVLTVDATFSKADGVNGYVPALERICKDVEVAINLGYKTVILSDTALSADRVPLSSLAAVGAVHQYLISQKKRTEISIFVETAEAREVHHLCVLLGYGADAVCPYLAIDILLKLKRENSLKDAPSDDKIAYNFCKAANDGILKVMSKMGVSTLHSYKGAQTFEALGLDDLVIQRCFSGTASRIKGIGFDLLAQEALLLHETAFPSRLTVRVPGLPEPGEYHWRSGGEDHINDPISIANLQDAVRRKNQSAYDQYSQAAYEQIKACTLRGLLTFNTPARPVPLEQVESWDKIVRRFCTGAMSYGSISNEAHTSLAVAMNRLGGKSNTGEGGEDPERSLRLPSGDSMRSAIKQVASGRFGVTSFYLADADELQIKMAQGAKPGEGGELPGYKVSGDIAKTRKSTPGVGLISPPPHHDIYSIEDLKQLIYDLKCANPEARVSVKLVSEVGVGVVAAGVAKAKADHILISGHDGGTGASRWTGIKHAGLPWELGLAETHQTLVLNNLRGRIVLQTDGQLKTGRDVAIACLLGAEEFGFATAPLIALGCTMMRKCHLNTCPVGVATQDPELRKKFAGQPEHVINFFYYVAQELRTIMARLGFRTINEMVGRSDRLIVNSEDPTFLRNIKARAVDLSTMLAPAYLMREGAATHNIVVQDHQLEQRLDNSLIATSEVALRDGTPVSFRERISNIDRAVGTTLSFHVSRRFGESGLPDNTIHIDFVGSAGQSLGAFLAPGITLTLEGDSNDYVGKGLSGGKIIIFPPRMSTFKAQDNIIVGNVCLYGATSGQVFIRGVAAERFAVRNSGAIAVVEGCGDHGCEYMTGGRVVVLGTTGRNFAAGMSGGIAYVYDPRGQFLPLCNTEMVLLEKVEDAEEAAQLKALIEQHSSFTQSQIASEILQNFNQLLSSFVKVFPLDYKKVLEDQKIQAAKQLEEELAKKAAAVPVHQPQAVVSQAQTVAIKKPHAAGPPALDIEDTAIDAKALEAKGKNIDKARGFMKYKREYDHYREAQIRAKDFKEISSRLTPPEVKVQAARCMDCGVPFCQSYTGCPISNIIPKWNDLVFRDQWKQAWERLIMTNNFPEFTGRVCPAPCEGACVLGINEKPVAIKSIECAIIDRAFAEGWVITQIPPVRTGYKVAIVGSGPAGLAAADQLNRAGHYVTVYERCDRIGGLLMYGIPNMKLDKNVVQRRVDLMASEGVQFVTNAHVGKNIDPRKLKEENDAIVLATGATWPRDLPIPNRNLNGIYFAMDFLQANTKSLLDSGLDDNKFISAKGKDVIVIGGGDTGNDCIGTAVRHGAKSVTNFELLPEPPAHRANDNPWPQFPRVFKVDYGHEEVKVQYGRDPREYCVLSNEFVSNGNGAVKGINTIKVEWTKDAKGQFQMAKVPGSERFFPADLVLLAMGFLGPEDAILKQLGVEKDNRSNIKTDKDTYTTSVEGVFAAGDCRRGQSLVVWGINEGRMAAREVDAYLMGDTILPVTGGLRAPREALDKKPVWAHQTRAISAAS